MPEVLGLRELGDDDEGVEAPSPSATEGDRRGAEPPDGEAEPVEGEAGQPSRWRRQIAVGVVVALAVGVALLLSRGGPMAERPAPRAGPAAIEPGTVEEAAVAALQAWARFASTGDVAVLEGTFSSAGPQYGRLRAEAAALAARPAAGSEFRAGVVGTEGDGGSAERVVVAEVVLARPGEADQRFSWDLVMRRHADGRWLLWTVRTRTSASPAPGGAP